jgi:hypothetical protein
LLLSKEAKLVSGITILVIPTIMYGGWALLGILTHGSAVPMPGDLRLDDNQWALWRAVRTTMSRKREAAEHLVDFVNKMAGEGLDPDRMRLAAAL